MQQTIPEQVSAAPVRTPSAADLGIRRVALQVEEVLTEAGTAPQRPATRAVVAIVLTNPWRGTPPERDLQPEVEQLAPALARIAADRLLDALGGVEHVEAFGKGAVVGLDGELEHGGALIHTPYFGNLLREFLGGESIICFADTRADAGEVLTVPMWHKTHAATRSHYQTITTRLSDAPRAGEIVVLAAASTGPRPHPRIGDRSTDPTVTSETLKDS
ncbi:amino acid synthesis family protein [Nocardioides rotundus]|uniref:amino acid synthesis family protein n=1 Tax=Nocardioides rotundus TaxID=1774216 RepID=UPI001CBC179C|nr:amino acid synthesis family protein [Nocardioides rotundus]UAL31444.1 amino acid synthesis family protein [Nocardioides rotundus]